MDTTKLDDLLNEAEAQEGNQIEWTLDQKYDVKNFYVDEHGIVDIKNKTIGDMSKHISVKGESYSQYIEFKISRFYDGIDLTNMLLAIYYDVPSVGSDESKPINVYYNETEMKFGWAIPVEVVQTNLTIDLCVYARGKLSDGNNYILKTKTATYQINDGLELGSGVIQPTNNWYTNFVFEMDSKVKYATDAANSALNSYNVVKEAETVVLQSKQIVEEKSEVVDTQYKEIITMHKEAEQYRDEAFQFRNEAEQFSPDGYSSLVEQVNKNTVKVDTIIEKADLGIQETVTGEQIHLTDSADSKVKEFALFGKATQKTTSGKNLLTYPYNETSMTRFGVTFTDLGDGTIHVNGTNTKEDGTAYLFLIGISDNYILPKGTYIISGTPIENNSDKKCWLSVTREIDSTRIASDTGSGGTFTLEEDTQLRIAIIINASATANNLIFKPMLRLASVEDDTWEPYTGGIPSPSPEYPQEIEISGESYNLLENTATTKTSSGITFTVNNDGTVTASGTTTNSLASIGINYDIRNKLKIGEKYILSGAKGVDNGVVKIALKDGIAFKESDNSDTIFTYNGEEIEYVSLIVRGIGISLNNSVFKPMIRKASVKNDRYMPYGKGSVEVKSVGKNLYNRNNDINRTNVGVTATISDGVMVLNGTATGTGALPTGHTHTIIDAKVGDVITHSIKVIDGTAILPSNTSISFCRFLNEKATEIYKLRGIAASGTIDKNTKFPSKTFVVTENMLGSDGRLRVNNQTYFYKDFVYNNLKLAVQLEKSSVATEYQPYKEIISTIPTPNGLARKSVSSGGSYTDSNGQQWICDEILKYADGSGEYVQRVTSAVFDGVNNKVNSVGISTEYGVSFASSKNSNTLLGKLVLESGNYYDLSCTHFITKYAYYNSATTKDYGCGIYRTNANIWFSIDKNTASKIGINVDTATVEQFNLWLQENPVIVYGILAEPIHTPLTAEQIAEIEKVCTFCPVTNISNDFDCGMKVTYLADSKNYIDNQLAIQAQAQEEEMMSMFLLLPDEVQATMIENDTNNLISGMEE